MKKIRTLAGDIAFANSGIVIFEDDNIIFTHYIGTKLDKKLTKTLDVIRRADVLSTGIDKIMTWFDIDRVVVEEAIGNQSKNAASGNKLGIAYGIFNGIMKAHKKRIYYVKPRDVKMALCNNPRADKNDIMAAVKAKYYADDFKPKKGEFEHIADAICVYEAYKRMKKYNEAIGVWK